MSSDVGVLPIVRPDVLWDTLLPWAQVALGRSVSASLDAKELPAFGAAPFISVVGEFAKHKSDAVAVLRSDKLALRHLQYVFLVAIHRKHFISFASLNIAVTPADVGDFAIMSGSMFDWYHAVLGLLSPPLCQEKHIKEVGVMLMAFFETEDFGSIWTTHRKEYTDDGWYILVAK